MKLPRVALAAALALIAANARAGERHLGPHVHGQATLQVAVDGSTLRVGLGIPGHDAVGFEHPPADPGQVRALAKARSVLVAGAWLVLPAAAGCRVAATDVSADGFDAGAPPGTHGDFDATYEYRCAQPDRLDALEVRLVEAFPALRRIVVDIVTADGSAQRTLDGAATRVELAP